MHRFALLLALGVAPFAPVAFANEPAAAEHGGPAAAEHGGPAAHGGAHHSGPTDDDDHNGVPNWRDRPANDGFSTLQMIGFHALNLAIVLFIVWRWGLPALRSSLSERAATINKDLQEAARLKAEAEARAAEVEARLAALEGELAAMTTNAARAGEAEEARIVAAAHAMAARIAETAERQIRDETQRATAEIRKEAVEQAVRLAREVLAGQVSAADQRRLANEFLSTVQQGASHV